MIYRLVFYAWVTVVVLLPENALAFRPHAAAALRPRQFALLRSVEVLQEVTANAELVQELAVEATSTATATPGLFSGVFTQMDVFWQTCPYTAAALVCGMKASLADWVAQTQQTPPEQAETLPAPQPPRPNWLAVLEYYRHHGQDEDEDVTSLQQRELDMKRNLAFIVYGALYQGITHEYVFNHCYPVWFGTGSGWEVVATKVAFNLFIQTTLVTLPAAYLCKAWIMQEHDNEGEDVTATALYKYWHDIHHQGLLWKCFALWGPVHCLTFSVVPEHWRVTFIAAVSFFWLILLSRISSNQEATETNTNQPSLTTAPVAR